MEVEGAMKVNNTVIFMGESQRSERQNEGSENRSSKNTIFAGNLNKTLDPIAQKKQEARKQALKVVGEAWSTDQEIDQSIEDSRTRVRECQSKIGEANTELMRIRDERLALRDSYGVAEDSQEEQDLQLLVKQEQAKYGGDRLTDEEWDRIADIEAQGLTEYQQRSLDMHKSGEYYEVQKAEAEQNIYAENSFISSTQRSRLEHQPMIKAEKTADTIMEAASKEIVGMLVDEAKDHVDEEMEEKKDAAEEKAEKEEEQEEKLEKIKEKKEDKEEFTERIAENNGEITQSVVEAEDVMSEIQREVRKIRDEMNLLEEDLKGAAVDTVG